MEIALIIMLWEISLVLAFIAGTKRKTKRATKANTTVNKKTEKTISRIQKEQENFMSYDGTPQDAINDFD